jgi:hypothetical protein
VSAETVAPARWRTTVCAALAAYGRDAQRDYTTLEGLSLQFRYGLPKMSETRDKESTATAALVDDTRRFRHAVEAAGIPRFAHGADYRTEIVSALQQLEDRLEALHTGAVDLPTGDDRPPKDALLTPRVVAALRHVGERLQQARERYPAANAHRCS